MSSLGFKSEVQQAMVIGHIGFPPQGGSHGLTGIPELFAAYD
jgi:hypothetical protein